jgi:hypothetical protein
VPVNSVPVDCDKRSNGWAIRSSPPQPEETIVFGHSWSEYLFTIAPWERMLLQ